MQIQNKCFSWLNRQKPGELRTSCNNSAYVLNDAAFRPYWMTYIPFIPSSLLVCNPAQACQESYVVSKLRCKHSVFKQRWSNRQAYWFTLKSSACHIPAHSCIFHSVLSNIFRMYPRSNYDLCYSKVKQSFLPVAINSGAEMLDKNCYVFKWKGFNLNPNINLFKILLTLEMFLTFLKSSCPYSSLWIQGHHKSVLHEMDGLKWRFP